MLLTWPWLWLRKWERKALCWPAVPTEEIYDEVKRLGGWLSMWKLLENSGYRECFYKPQKAWNVCRCIYSFSCKTQFDDWLLLVAGSCFSGLSLLMITVFGLFSDKIMLGFEQTASQLCVCFFRKQQVLLLTDTHWHWSERLLYVFFTRSEPVLNEEWQIIRPPEQHLHMEHAVSAPL